MRIFLVLSVVLLFVTSAWSDDLTAEKQERSFTMQAHPELSIHNGDGRTIVRAHDSADIVVRYTKEVTHVKTADEAKKQADRVTVRIEQIGNKLEVEAKYPKEWGISFGTRPEVYVNFEVLVPAESDVYVKASDGDTEIDGIKSHTDLSLSDGDAVIQECSGDLAVKIGDGDLHLKDCAGANMKIKTTDGDVTATDCSGTIDMKAGDGKINLNHIDGSLNMEAGDGSAYVDGKFQQLVLKVVDADLKLTVENGSVMQDSWWIKATDGDVSLQLPQDFSANINISTSDGKINTNVPIGVVGRISTSKLSGKLNNGGQIFEIHTTDGDIDIR